MKTASTFDVIVVGGGHAGCEAASASSRLGARTLLLTHDVGKIGEMSCNPAIGGVGKGHLVREIDALDGLMGHAADQAGIHFKLLNRSKGPAVHGPRAQMDRGRYRQAIRSLLDELETLTILDGAVAELSICNGRVDGVRCEDGRRFLSGAVVVTTGTFLRGIIHVGRETTPAGRIGEAPSTSLAEQLQSLGLRMARLKTGTPPRLARTSIDWDSLPEDRGDVVPSTFSQLTNTIGLPQIACRVTSTNPLTHDMIRQNLGCSAAYGGEITGKGPRYCPSIEDKIVRFPAREAHQVFLEPEGLFDGPDGAVVYPNGLSTSLPPGIQAKFLATMRGLEKVEIVRHGYLVEYDHVDPRELDSTLAVRRYSGLFLAGQINGTTGYEEAAAQGLLAGLNAARSAGGLAPAILRRDQSFIGVMIDDLTTCGASEPYRMFTSRSEYRLTIRSDNADLRLTPLGLEWGCVRRNRAALFRRDHLAIETALTRARSEIIVDGGSRKTIVEFLGSAPSAIIAAEGIPWIMQLPARARQHLLTEAVYHGYLDRQQREIAALASEHAISVPPDLNYAAIGGLSAEMRERLEAVRPTTFGQARRIPGMSPPALMALLGALRRRTPEIA